MKHKKLFVSLTAIFSVIIFFAVFLMIWFYGDSYKSFDSSFREEFEIPGLADGAVPQGMATCPAEYYVFNESVNNIEAKSQKYFFISAYMVDGSPSRIYVVGEETGYVGYVTMKTENNEDFYGHCGGIAVNNTESAITSATSAKYYTLWVTGGKDQMIHCAKASDEFSSAKKSIAQEVVDKAGRKTDGSEGDKFITFTASFKANCNPAFLFYYDDPSVSGVSSDRLYVGEFYRSGNYETNKMHWLTTPEGYQNTAFMYEYNVTSSTENKYGLYTITKVDGLTDSDLVPRIYKIFSIPEQIQGVAFSGRKSNSSNDGLLVLSQSYGLANSHMLCFDFSKVITSGKKYTDLTGESFKYDGVVKKFGNETVDYTDNTLYVYFADKADSEIFVNDYSIPSMSEGMCVPTPTTSSDGASIRVYVLFESAGKKYKTFVRQQLNHVYSFVPKAK